MEKEQLSIKAARVNADLTQEALAQKLGVAKRTVVSWENGDTLLKPVNLFALAYVFKTDADFLKVPQKNLK